jgi:hypothetical protein
VRIHVSSWRNEQPVLRQTSEDVRSRSLAMAQR